VAAAAEEEAAADKAIKKTGLGQRTTRAATEQGGNGRRERQETAQQTTDYEVRVVVMRFYFISSEKWKVGREREVDVEEGRGVMWLDGIPTTWRGDDASQWQRWRVLMSVTG